MDKSNFSEQIKHSFEEVFQQEVPQKMWTELSSTLEEEGLLSEGGGLSNEEKALLQSSFEDVHQEQAPEFVWEQIASSIEEEEQPTEGFGEIIKSSFLNSGGAKAPNIWANIEAEIEPQAAEDTIRDSFESSYKGKAPDYIWNAVRHQINIDGVWERLTAFLDRMRYRQLWRQRLRRWASYATVITLMHACLPIIPTGFGELPLVPKRQQEPLGPLAEQNSEDNTKEDSNEQNVSALTNSRQLPTLSKKLPSEQLAVVETFSTIGTRKKKTATVFEQPNFTQTFKSKKNWGLPLVIPRVEEGNKLKLEEEVIALVKSSENKSELEEGKNEQSVSKEELFSINWLSPVAYELLENNIAEIKTETELYPKELSSSKRRKSTNMEVGLITAIGSSLFLNEETFQSWDENSLLNHDLSRFTHIGLLFVQPLSKKSALSVELSGFHQIRQGFGFFSTDGYYKSKVKELNYARFAALYQQEIYNYELFGLKTALLGRAGFYLAYLTEERAILNAVSNSTNSFSKYDLGTKFMIGQVHRWDNFVFEYGGQLDMGLLNVFNGQSFGTNIQIDQTRILNMAAYLSLRYQF